MFQIIIVIIIVVAILIMMILVAVATGDMIVVVIIVIAIILINDIQWFGRTITIFQGHRYSGNQLSFIIVRMNEFLRFTWR